MNKEATNVELEELYLKGGEVIPEEKKFMQIPPDKSVEKNSDPKENGMLEIQLEGKGYANENKRGNEGPEIGE